MYTAKTSATLILCLLLFFASIPAHGMPQDTQSRAAVTTDVTIIIEKEKVRLTARQAVEYLQLQILDAAGEVVFDSGPIQGNEIAWPFQNGAGEAVKSGLYAYRLTVKEAGKESAQTRRGHFIVDRAKDRDGADKLWVTSRNDDGVGVDLTMARDETMTVVGTTSSNGRSAGHKGESSNHGGEREIEEKAQSLAATSKAAVAAIAAGSAGKIAKFTSATDLGDSVITELNGNVGVGTSNPLTKLHILSDAGAILPPRLQSSGATSFAAGWDFYHGTTGKGYIGVPNPSAGLAPGEMMMYSAPGTKTSLWAGGKRSVTIDTNGAVGIGTANPASELHVHGLNPFITLSTAAGAQAYIQNAGGSLVFKPTGSGYGTAAMVMQANTLNVGIGSTDPKAKLEVASGSGDILRLIGYEPFITLFDSRRGYTPTYIQNAGGNLVFKPSGFGSCCAAMVMQANTGNVGIGTSDPQAKLDVVGQTRTQSLQITGGADFAENFDVNVETTGDEELAAKVEAGMVVSIDPTSPGKLRLSAQAYDRRVAGIISGAGGVKPGMMMSQEGTMADGKHPVALSGRVYVWADASQGAIEPGDLLTTSATPGHAMKVADATKAQGAIIGKAMTGLKDGKGLVLALVTLQ
ncbi:MAG: hypothetical protein ACREEM_51375 [Blastocatellia bacterium]